MDQLVLIPSTGSVLEISVNDELLFSKKALKRYPEKGEVEELVGERLVEKEDKKTVSLF